MTLFPDIAGFRTAAVAMREQLGSKATFRIPVAQTWPGGTRINPDSGLPYDATVKPTSEPFTNIEKTILIIMKQGSPLRPQSDTFWEQAGDLSGMDIIVEIGPVDYADVKEASEMTINGLHYKIEEAKPFSLASSVYRYLVYGKER